jgi:Tfp pilus assembly protein FimV
LKRCIGLCVLLSQSVFGLEFGNPQVQSTQNAPLEVHIPVLDLGQTSASQLFPLLAPEGEFTARGMSRPESLSTLTYTVASEADETRLVIRSESAWPDSELMTLGGVIYTRWSSVLFQSRVQNSTISKHAF